MKKHALTLTLALALVLTLAACGGAPVNNTSTPTPSPSADPAPTTPSEPVSADGTVYTTVINEADVTFTLAADQKSIVVDAMGMTVEGSCEVKDNVLTFKEQTSGNAQIWASLTSRAYTLNDDGTATAMEVASEQNPDPEQGDEPTYPENSLVLDFTPDTSEQLRKTFHVESGTWGVAFGGQGDYTPTDSADELFAWTTTGSSVHLTFFADGTYKYEFTTMNIEETGTWTWTSWNLTVTTDGGNSFTGSINK